MEIVGVDIGGTSIKAATVDVDRGRVTGGTVEVETPDPGRPEQLVEAVASLLDRLDASSAVGATFPGKVRRGTARTAVNLDRSCVGVDLAARFEERTGVVFTVVNDADAAAIAEHHFGAARDCDGTVALVTLGTGVGTALLHGGRLVPNCELGAIEIEGRPASETVSRRAREEQDMDWPTYARHLEAFIERVELLVDPQLLVLGGGGSEDARHYLPLLETKVDVVAAAYGNEAGIVGAALAAAASL